MMDLKSNTSPLARRKSIVINSDSSRVITRPYLPGGDHRIRHIIDRVLRLDQEQVVALLDNVMHDFAHRHRYLRATLERHFNAVASHVPNVDELSKERRMLIGTYFTAEYSIESAALFNPSMVKIESLDIDPPGSCRFIMSFRATGEGHISSIEFRGGIITANDDIYVDALSDYVDTPEMHTNPSYDRHLFRLKLEEMGASNAVTDRLLNKLASDFTFNDLQAKIAELHAGNNFPAEEKAAAIDMANWLAKSNYEIVFRADHPVSERVIFPVSESESKGIEDARFVRFVDDDGAVVYYATYTAYNGETILPQLIETRDFLSFNIRTLNGKQVQDKGMALFPRKIDGKYVMLSRQDGENNSIMFSDNVRFWQEAQILQEPEFPYEFVQMGNGGSPIETADGWLVITHGVGPMRTYSLGIQLLDLNDPTRIIGRLEEPILMPNSQEREGYVPNVVYTCGAMIHQNELIIPYAASDQRCSIAILRLPELMARLKQRKAA